MAGIICDTFGALRDDRDMAVQCACSAAHQNDSTRLQPESHATCDQQTGCRITSSLVCPSRRSRETRSGRRLTTSSSCCISNMRRQCARCNHCIPLDCEPLNCILLCHRCNHCIEEKNMFPRRTKLVPSLVKRCWRQSRSDTWAGSHSAAAYTRTARCPAKMQC